MATYKETVQRVSHFGPVEAMVKSRFMGPVVDLFVAGPERDDGLNAAEVLRDARMFVTLDSLGEDVKDLDQAAAVRDEYLGLLDSIHEKGFQGEEVNVSLKLTLLGLEHSPEACEENLRAIVERAAEYGNFVRIDMEGSRYTQRTLDLFEKLRPDHPNLGVVIQSYLKRSEDDIEKLVKDSARVRLVKGAYAENDDVAFTQKARVDEEYKRLMEILLDGGIYPAIATHDPKLIERAIDFAERNGKDPKRFEFQMLYGVRTDLQKALVDQEYNVRIYVPYGPDWYGYFSRRLGERPANLAFIAWSFIHQFGAMAGEKVGRKK